MSPVRLSVSKVVALLVRKISGSSPAAIRLFSRSSYLSPLTVETYCSLILRYFKAASLNALFAGPESLPLYVGGTSPTAV